MTEDEKFDIENKAFHKKFKKMFNYEKFHKNYPIEWNDIFNGKITEVKNEQCEGKMSDKKYYEKDEVVHERKH
jgi:hypothetical protein